MAMRWQRRVAEEVVNWDFVCIPRFRDPSLRCDWMTIGLGGDRDEVEIGWQWGGDEVVSGWQWDEKKQNMV